VSGIAQQLPGLGATGALVALISLLVNWIRGDRRDSDEAMDVVLRRAAAAEDGRDAERACRRTAEDLAAAEKRRADAAEARAAELERQVRHLESRMPPEAGPT
jgi:hypothetical protein